MKKIALIVLIVISFITSGCPFLNTKTERMISGKILNISGPEVYNGLPCMILTWQDPMMFSTFFNGGWKEVHNSRAFRSYYCYVFSTSAIAPDYYSSLINKDIEIKYRIRRLGPPMLQIISIQELSSNIDSPTTTKPYYSEPRT